MIYSDLNILHSKGNQLINSKPNTHQQDYTLYVNKVFFLNPMGPHHSGFFLYNLKTSYTGTHKFFVMHRVGWMTVKRLVGVSKNKTKNSISFHIIKLHAYKSDRYLF